MEVRMKMEGRRKANQKNNFHVLRTVSRIVLLQRNYKTIINFQLNWFFLTLSSTQIKSTTKLNTSIEWISFLSKEKDWLLCLCKSQNTELPPIEAISLQLLKLKLSFNKNHTLKINHSLEPHSISMSGFILLASFLHVQLRLILLIGLTISWSISLLTLVVWQQQFLPFSKL